MAEELSPIDRIRQLRAGGAGREALLQPNTDLERFQNVVGGALFGAAENVENLLTNLSSTENWNKITKQFQSELKKRPSEYKKLNLPILDIGLPEPVTMAFEVGKIPFMDIEPSKDTYIESKSKEFKAEEKAMDIKDKLAKQYAGGGIGEVAGELAIAAPLFTIGTMARTSMAMAAGGTPVEIAGAVAADSIRNAFTMGTAEFGLSKFYGESDVEALEKGTIAGLTGGLGTPIVGAAKVASKSIKPKLSHLSEKIGEKALATKIFVETDGRATSYEAMAKQAGGGTPSEELLKELREIDRKTIQNVKVKPGEELTGQTDVETPNVKKLDITFDDDRGRQYSESWLNSYQGKSTDKAAVIKLPEGDISKNLDGYINSMKRTFKSHIDTIETYGGVDTKFKAKGSMTKAEKKITEISFQKDLLFKLAKDNRIGLKQRRALKRQANDLNTKLSKVSDDFKSMRDDIKEKTEISYSEQPVPYRTPIKYNLEAKSQFEKWKQSNKGFEKGEYSGFSKEFEAKHKVEQEKILSENVSKKMDRKAFVEAVDFISTDMKSKGKTFDIDNITQDVAHDYQSIIHKITDYIERENDIKLLKQGEISNREFAFRESKRLDAKYRREPITGAKYESKEDLEKAILEKEQSYSDIGLHKPAEKIEVKEQKIGDIKSEIKDKTDYPKLDKQRKRKLEALDAYRNKKILRYSSGDRIGEPILTKTQMRDVDEFGDILSNEEILNKTQPRVSDIDKIKETKKAQEFAKKKVKLGQIKKLGIDFKFEPRDIMFKQTILDVKNSMGQIAAVITGSKDFAEQVFVKGDNKEFRELLADKMSERLGRNVEKKDVKTPVMITGYGSQKKGTTRAIIEDNNSWIKTEQEANEFMDVFYDEFANLAPELRSVMEILEKIHATRKSPIYEWTMPDGYKVRFDLSDYKDYIVKGAKSEGLAKVRTEKVNKMSRALLPNVFHSIDGYIARQMRERMKIHTTHDAWHIPKGREEEAQQVYRDILSEINDSNLMGDIFEDIGYSGWKKAGKLPDEMLSRERKLLDAEHVADVAEKAEISKPLVSKQMTESEVMRDFMASGSHRNHEYFKMIDAMIDESVQSSHNLGKARENDDVYERALAYALQGTEFDKSKMIQVPKDSKIDKDKWFREQTDIFNEFRAKAEFNPDLVDTIKGERKYFTKDGEIIGATIRSKRQIRNEIQKELTIAKNRLKATGSNIDIDDVKTLKKEVSEIENKIKAGDTKDITPEDIEKVVVKETLKPKEIDLALAKKMDDDSVKPSDFDTQKQSAFDEVLTHIKDKYKDTKEYKQYSKLLGIMKNPQKDAEQAGDHLKKFVDDLLDGENQEDWTKYLFETDASAIREFKTRYDADKFFQENIDLYHRAKPAIDQLAKAIGREEHQVGAFLNNAMAIAREYDIPKSRIEDLDKIVSIKAMEQNKAWDFYEKHYGSDKFNTLMDISITQKDRSSNLFIHTNSQHKQVKGFISEYYDGGKVITDDGKIIYDAETKEEVGALGIDLTQNKVGKFESKDINPDEFNSREEMIAFALKNNLKITDKGWRKIPTAEIKDKAGRKNTLSDRLGATEASIQKKAEQFNSAVRILTDEGAYDLMFSNVAKDGFVEVTKEQKMKLPYIMQEDVKFVNAKYVKKLLGREEIRLIRKNATQAEKLADRLASNLVTMLKQSVVLKNPASYKSALLVNFTTNALIDPNVIRATKNAKKSYELFTEYRRLTKEIDIARATGKDFKKLQYELKDNEIQKYLDLGLSINTLDGVRGQSSLLTHLASDLFGNRLDKVANEVMMNQRGMTGNVTKNVFSFIDFQGRYMAIKSLENKGLSSADAVRRANDLFGQMDDMAPAFVQIIDKYGAFIFAKWLASVAPATLKAAKNNPGKALALTLGLYYASSESDIMLSNISPLESIIDMTASGSSGDSFVWNRKMYTNIVPKVYRELWKQGEYMIDESQHWHEAPAMIWKNRAEQWTDKEGNIIDYRGMTQKTLDKIIGD